MTDTGAQSAPRCYRHPKVETYLSCSRCGRPICPDCMIEAPVGFQCMECFYPTGSGGSAQAPRAMNRAAGLAVVIALGWTLVLALVGFFAYTGTPNILLAGIAGGVTGWALWRMCGRAWNSRTARLGLILGLAMPLLAALLILLSRALLFHTLALDSLIAYSLRVLVAMAVSALFAFLAASPPDGW